jgi:hypothetical protein
MNNDMSKKLTPKEISQLFKLVFEGEKGEMVLSKIKSFCGGYPTQVLSCPESANMTFFNLGANAVYRYIQRQIDMDCSETVKDCILIEETGD